MTARKKTAGGQNTLRIVGGRWRGRKLHFPDVAAIRPTPDRVRETLFNWLQDRIVGARCLDLFAGSGALGFEALSRGAAGAVFVEREPQVVRYLQEVAATLQATGAAILRADAREFVATLAQRADEAFDIVFLDPPFAERLLPSICAQLEASGKLAPAAMIYIESAAAEGPPAVPANWTLAKGKSAGQVGYYLAHRLGHTVDNP